MIPQRLHQPMKGVSVSSEDTNYWLDESNARAFWDQRQAVPYQELLQHTAQLMTPAAGERWLDLGCGRGELTAALWQRGNGQLAEIVAMDCAAVNAEPLARLQRKLNPPARPEQIRFMTGNFSDGLTQFADSSFDGIVSGLAISYAESIDPVTGQYTDSAYNHLLSEMYRILKPGGRLVFSVNVPQPDFWKVFWKSLSMAFRVSKPLKVLANTWKMQKTGAWLRKEARRGRFHYFKVEEIVARLQNAGFDNVSHRLSFAEQAYLLSCGKSSQASKGAA